MPRKPLRAKRKLRAETEPWQIEFLMHGRVLRDDGRTSPKPFLYQRQWDGYFAHEAAHPLWEEKRDEILAAWVKERPGTRPWAFWQYDIQEDRPEDESQAAYLRRMDLLSPGEMEESHEV